MNSDRRRPAGTSPAAGEPGFAEVWGAVVDVAGWMTEGQARLLFDSARHCPENGTIVEIGSFRGRSTIVLASASDPSVRVVAVDPHAGNDRGPQEIDGFADAAADDNRAFEANLTAAGVRNRVEHLRMFSDDAADVVTGTVDVLYVDGAHRFRPARSDISRWGARVSDGGVMLIHDSFSSIGVTAAIMSELVGSQRFRYEGRSRSLAVYRATSPGPTARVASAAHQLAQLPWFAWNVTKKVLISSGIRRHGEWPY